MRKALFHLLTNDDVLQSLVPAERWWTRSAVPDSPPLPFAVLGHDGRQRVGPGLRTYRASLWVYEERQSYDLIDEVLERAFVLLHDVVNFRFEDSLLAYAIPGDISIELYDDQWRANTRNLSFTMIGS